MKRHGMLDLETLSTEVYRNPVVLSVGIVTTSGLKVYVELPTAAQLNRHRSPRTVAWWSEQNDNLPERCEAIPKWHMRNRLLAVRLVLTQVDYLWANGAGFDIPILESLFAEHGINWPLPYNAPRCYRTLFAAVRRGHPGFERGLIEHNALADAVSQLEILKSYTDLEKFEN